MRVAGYGQYLLHPVREENVKCKENKNNQKVYSVCIPILRLDIIIIKRNFTLEEDQKGSPAKELVM